MPVIRNASNLERRNAMIRSQFAQTLAVSAMLTLAVALTVGLLNLIG